MGGGGPLTGPCPGLQTIGRAELADVVHVLRDAEPGAIITDCLGVVQKCMAIQRGLFPTEAVLKEASADLLWEAWQLLRGAPGVDPRVVAQPSARG